MENEEEFHNALDEFPFYDCDDENLPEPIESNCEVSVSDSNPNPSPKNKPNLPPLSLRRRQTHVHRESILNPRERQVLECEKKLENEVELKQSLVIAEDETVHVESNEQSDECSTVTDASKSRGEGLVGNDLDLIENYEGNSSFLFVLAGLMIKAVAFQIDLLVKFFMFPVWLTYNLYMLLFDPFGLLKRGRWYFVQKMRTIYDLVFQNVSPFVWEWFREHNDIWKFGVKCGWGLLWSVYVCAILTGLLVSAFVMGGLVVKGVVEEPMRLKSNLNFDYTEKSPVAFVPIIAQPEVGNDVYFEEKTETGKSTGSRVISPNHKLQVTVSLTLPESDYNQNLGIFQVRVDFLSADGKTLASSRRPCMLQYRSQAIRLLLTFLKVAPILTGYTSETQNLKIHFKGFTEGEKPTDCLRVVIEQRAEFKPGAGIPEIYDASLTLVSELPLLKKVVWFWKKTLFIWTSMTIFTMELVFALICCKPFIIPKLRLKEATNRGASHNNRPGLS